MMKTALDGWITSLDVKEPDCHNVELFHQQTKFYPSTNTLSDRRIATHLCDQRAILEASSNRKRYFGRKEAKLPEPESIEMSLGQAVRQRRSCRNFSGETLDDQQLSNILATLRVTATTKSVAFPDIEITLRTYASGGGLYPVETYVARRNFETGYLSVFHYSPHEHSLTEIVTDVPEATLKKALSDQTDISDGVGCFIFFTGVFRRTLTKYGAPGYKFVLIEVGEMAHQIALAATSTNLTTLLWSGSYDDYVNRILAVDGVNESVLLTIMLGGDKNV